jgi:hypothetical protein
VADLVRQNDEIFRRVQRLAGPEQFTRESLRDERATEPPVPCMISTALSALADNVPTVV